MGDSSTIEWTDATWNPVTGCSKVSPGCAHCYAETLTRRFSGIWHVPDLPWTPENARENVILHPERLDQPLRWQKPRMVFVNSMSDLFHEEVPDGFIGAMFAIMVSCPQHTFQVLTKRPGRMRDWMRRYITKPTDYRPPGNSLTSPSIISPGPPPNVWLGVSIENRRYVNRADLLRETPAAVRFISAEPLLGPLIAPNHIAIEPDDDGYADPQDWEVVPFWGDQAGAGGPDELDLTGIDWLIVGGESGQGHRPMKPEWVRDLRNYCQHSRHLYDPNTGQRGPGTAFFFKQWGGRTPKAGGRELDGRTWNEMPQVAA